MAMIASGIGTWLQVNRYGIVGSGTLTLTPVSHFHLLHAIALAAA